MSYKITWLGHATFKIEIDSVVIYVDPWFENPKFPKDVKPLEENKIDYVLVSHGHFDHSVSAPSILNEKSGSKMVCMYEILEWSKSRGVDEKQVIGMNKGGTVDLGNDISVTMVNADHSSACPGDKGLIPGGQASGFVITFPNKDAVYFGGDTNVFYDMKLICDLYKPTVAILPIGGHFTMAPKEAAYAVDNLLHTVSKVIPMHFGTFPLLAGTPAELEKLITRKDVSVDELTIGKTYDVFKK